MVCVPILSILSATLEPEYMIPSHYLADPTTFPTLYLADFLTVAPNKKKHPSLLDSPSSNAFDAIVQHY